MNSYGVKKVALFLSPTYSGLCIMYAFTRLNTAAISITHGALNFSWQFDVTNIH